MAGTGRVGEPSKVRVKGADVALERRAVDLDTNTLELGRADTSGVGPAAKEGLAPLVVLSSISVAFLAACCERTLEGIGAIVRLAL